MDIFWIEVHKNEFSEEMVFQIILKTRLLTHFDIKDTGRVLDKSKIEVIRHRKEIVGTA